jgi:hypothetical protein
MGHPIAKQQLNVYRPFRAFFSAFLKSAEDRRTNIRCLADQQPNEPAADG